MSNITHVGTPSTSTTGTLSLPTGAAAGDLAVYCRTAKNAATANPGHTAPSGWTSGGANGNNAVFTSISISYKVLDAADITAGSITDPTVGDQMNRGTIHIFRPDTGYEISAVTISPATATDRFSFSTSNPAPVTLDGSSHSAPVVIVGFGVQEAGDTVSFSTETPAFDDKITAGAANMLVGYKVYNSSPADHTIDIGDSGAYNGLRGLVLALTLTSGTPYTLACSAGSFSLTGVAALLKASIFIAAVQGAYTLTGLAALLKAARLMAAAVGTYTFTGIDATLLKGKRLSVDAGTFALTGVAALFPVTLKIIAAAGAYTLTGVAATLRYGRIIAAALGTYALTGVDATFRQGKAMAAAVGTYALTGVAATLNKGKLLALDAGAYALTGIAVNLLRPIRHLVAEAGAYVFTGGVVGLLSAAGRVSEFLKRRVARPILTAGGRVQKARLSLSRTVSSRLYSNRRKPPGLED